MARNRIEAAAAAAPPEPLGWLQAIRLRLPAAEEMPSAVVTLMAVATLPTIVVSGLVIPTLAWGCIARQRGWIMKTDPAQGGEIPAQEV